LLAVLRVEKYFLVVITGNNYCANFLCTDLGSVHGYFLSDHFGSKIDNGNYDFAGLDQAGLSERI